MPFLLLVEGTPVPISKRSVFAGWLGGMGQGGQAPPPSGPQTAWQSRCVAPWLGRMAVGNVSPQVIKVPTDVLSFGVAD